MFEFDESIEQGAIIRVIGIGAFGLRVAGNMVGRIHKVECLGVMQKGSMGPDNLPLASLPRCSNQDHHDVAALLELLGTSDLVFIVANLDEDDGLLEDVCNALHNGNIPTFLVIPESACSMERKTGSIGLERLEKVTLDGVMILSESSMEPPYPQSWDVQVAFAIQVNLFQLAIRQITDLITSHGLMGIDIVDVMVTICGGIMKLGAGIASGDEGAYRAAEKASTCLKNQAIELQAISSMLNSVYGSSNIMRMDDYNSVSKFIHGQINDECIYRLGVIHDNSLEDNLLVSFIAIQRPSAEAVFPPWVRLYDKYDRIRNPK